MPDRRESDDQIGTTGQVRQSTDDPLLVRAHVALAHARQRNARVVQVLCFVSLLYSIERIGSAARVTVESQQWRGTEQDPAGSTLPYLPGELQFDSTRMSELAEHPLTRRRIASLFSDAETLTPELVKAVDADRISGQRDRLCDALELTTRHILGCPTPARCISRTGVRTAYHNIWIPRARQSFNRTLEILAEHFGDGAVNTNDDAQIEALQLMSSNLNRPPAALLDVNIERLEREFM